MSTAWAAYLIRSIGIKTVVLIGGDQVKLDNQKKYLRESIISSEDVDKVTVLTYCYDFSTR